MEQEKLLKWCKENFDFDNQKWNYDIIPDEILDCIIVALKEGTNYEYEGDDDFVDDFILDIVNSKYGTITKLWLKGIFNDETKHLFD